MLSERRRSQSAAFSDGGTCLVRKSFLQGRMSKKVVRANKNKQGKGGMLIGAAVVKVEHFRNAVLFDRRLESGHKIDKGIIH